MSDFEHCNLCGKHVSSLQTYSLFSEFFFCLDCGHTIIYPRMKEVLSSFLDRLKSMPPDMRDKFAIIEVTIAKEPARVAYTDTRSTRFDDRSIEASSATNAAGTVPSDLRKGEAAERRVDRDGSSAASEQIRAVDSGEGSSTIEGSNRVNEGQG